MPHKRIGLVVAFVSFAAALVAAHLYYMSDRSVWPLLLIGIALLALGFQWNARGTQPSCTEYASQGHLVLSVGIVLLIVAILLWLPPTIRVAEEPEFSSVAAIDAKVDRFLKAQQTDSSVLAAATVGGFKQGDAVLACDDEATRVSLMPLLDAAETVRKRGQRSVLLLIGMTDRTPLKPALKQQYESNVALAAARVDAVRACLRADAPHMAETVQILRLTTGPAYSPQVREAAPAETAKLALDRQVSALLFSLPVAAAAPPNEPSSPPSSSAVGERTRPDRQWLRCLLLIVGVGGLLGLAAAIFRKLPKQSPAGAPAGQAAVPACDKAAEALAHVREMHQMFAELRTRNFNFFIVIVAAVITAAATLSERSNALLPFVAALAVALTCVIFFGIERRTVEMLGDARKELERLEEPMGVNLNRRDKWEGATGPRRRYVTHTNLYMAAFAIVYGAALVAIRLHYP